MTPILVLRPQPGADATAARIRARGLPVVVTPLFARVPLAWTPPPPDAVDHLLVTSAAVFDHGGAGLAAFRQLPLVAVGGATAAAARAAGFTHVAFMEGGDVHAAAALLARRGARRVLHLAGADRMEADVPDATVMPIAVYASRPAPPPDSFTRALVGPAIALVHSARAGARLGALVTDRDHLSIVAISAAAARAAGDGWRAVSVAAAPTDAAMVEQAAALVHAG
ncbi:uroporphyrinogen-III synthase [Sphingomonas jejuensis]|uniref:Uroporphyrinogen-III synthase n=1 Tax=Sphingomonas jejuensis TaxID=904715 RepID=A0ABX0XNN0_9SPHN|nr:uroporphyrinogen-III synthase [Sphingomonas jejuensis]NJC34845.1 uroporphyrinogen-III synthase [Sphingomonas jejuensis]